MTTNDVVTALASDLAAAGYPVSLAPAVAAIWPRVTVGPPTITPVPGVCAMREYALAVRVAGAGTDPTQIADLYDAVDAVVDAVPTAWTAGPASPADDAGTDDPTYSIPLTLETTWP